MADKKSENPNLQFNFALWTMRDLKHFNETSHDIEKALPLMAKVIVSHPYGDIDLAASDAPDKITTPQWAQLRKEFGDALSVIFQ